MTPQILGPNQERGYYIVWDAGRWQKDRVSSQTHDSIAQSVLTQNDSVNLS